MSIVLLDQSHTKTNGSDRRLNFLNNMLSILAGFLVFSPIGSSKILNIGGNFYPEVFVIPALLIWRLNSRNVVHFSSVIFDRSGRLFVLLLIPLVSLGLYLNNGDGIAVYADLRCVFLMFISYKFVSKADGTDKSPVIKSIEIMIIYSLIGHAVFYQFFHDDVFERSVKNGYPAAGLIFLAYLYYTEFKTNNTILVAVGAIFVAVTSFYRQNMLLAIFVILIAVFSFMRDLTGRGAKLYQVAGVIIFVAMLFIASIYFDAWTKIIQYLGSDDSRKAQSIGKLDNIILFFQTGRIGGGDDVRIAYLDFIYTNFSSFLLPSGLGYRSLGGLWGPIWSPVKMRVGAAASIDGMHLYLALHFGLIISFILACTMGYKIFKSLRQVRGGLNKFARILAIVAIIVIALVSGNMFSNTASALTFGALMGLLVSRSAFAGR